jgi:chloramphenicol-sensitive protein RarD
VISGVAAQSIWGVAILYWPLLADLPAVSILAHRMIWSCLLLLGVMLITRRFRETAKSIKDRRTLLTLVCCAAILAFNWGLFLWTVNNGRVIEASLGYYITPLLNVLMGRVLLGEKMSRPQGLAILLALLGVGYGVAVFGHFPGIGLLLAGSSAVYGYLQKTVRIEAVPSLFVETAVIFPFALIWLFVMHPVDLGGLIGWGPGRVLLLMGTSLCTALPLALFGYAARHIPLAMVGIIQYLSPSLNFLLAVLFMGEIVKPADMVTFPLIWCGLIIYTWDTARTMRAMRSLAKTGTLPGTGGR